LSFSNAKTKPIPANVAINDDPPAEISGSGTPRTGRTPSTTAMFTADWLSIQITTPRVVTLAKVL
jgi:hypothetical protein